MSRRLVVLGVLSTVFLVTAAAVVVVLRQTRELRIFAVLPRTEGLRVGAPVTYLGVDVGRVERMTLENRRVVVDLRISRRDLGLRAGDSLQLARAASAPGGRLLDVVRANPSGILLSAGDTLHMVGIPTDARLHADDHRIAVNAVDRIGPDEIATALRNISETARGVVFPDSRDEEAQYVFNRRTDPSDVEQHSEWDDIIVVKDGRGFVRHGGTWERARPIYLGERRGGALVNPHEVAIGPGDVVRIPAGEPHRIVPDGDAPLSYLVIKVHVVRGS